MIRRWVREPLVQFLVIGAAIFGVARLLEHSTGRAGERIVVDSALVQRLAQLYQVQTGLTPDPAEVDHLVASYIHEEALYREARKLGLDKDDEIIRRRLVQKMESLNSDLTSAVPSDEQSRRYFAVHASEFATLATVSFTHLYFSADRRGEEGARAAALGVLRRLSSQGVTARDSAADPFPLQDSYAELSEADLQQVFGHTPLVTALFEIPQGRWCGPFRSGFGWHLVFVSHLTQSHEPSFESVKAQVRNAVQEAQSRLARERWNQEIESRYAIVRDISASARR